MSSGNTACWSCIIPISSRCARPARRSSPASGARPRDQLKPRTLFADIIENVADQHAIILNRTREASMLLPGKSLLVYELEPALFATVAANEAEKAAPGITLVDLQMIGASGRLFIAGTTRECELARDRIDEVLGAIEGRQSGRYQRLRRIAADCDLSCDFPWIPWRCWVNSRESSRSHAALCRFKRERAAEPRVFS